MPFLVPRGIMPVGYNTARHIYYRSNIHALSGSLACRRRYLSSGNIGLGSEKAADRKTAIFVESADKNKTLTSHHDGKSTLPSIFDLDSIFILCLPITNRRSFIYCHHKPSLLSSEQLKAIPWVDKMENKLVDFARRGWGKLVNSDLKINKQIVSLVSKMLNSIPYHENCLRSFPSKRSMVREISGKESRHMPRAVITSEVDDNNVSSKQLKKIPVYHPGFEDTGAIIDQLQYYKGELVSYHSKWALFCALGIPLSLPVALVPVVPNVPGFYLAYRLYCHLQAIRGAKNLGHLLGSEPTSAKVSDNVESSSTMTHLSLQMKSELDRPYKLNGSPDPSRPEYMLIGTQDVDNLVKITGLKEIKEDLYRACIQESTRLDDKKTD